MPWICTSSGNNLIKSSKTNITYIKMNMNGLSSIFCFKLVHVAISALQPPHLCNTLVKGFRLSKVFPHN